MHPVKKILIIFSILALTSPLFAAKQAEVALQRSGDLRTLRIGGFDVIDVSDGGLASVILYNDDEEYRLRETGLRYFISQQNIGAWLAARNRHEGPDRDDMGGYRTFAEMVEELNNLHDEYGEIVGEPISIGQSIEENEIWAIKISDNPEHEDDSEPEVLLTSLIHAREGITAEVIFDFAHYLVENYGEDQRVTDIVNDREIWLIPCHNPDGYLYNEQIYEESDHEELGMWRKNRRHNEDDSWGVDLNRNWGYMWGFDDEGSDDRPADNCYRGAEAFSEPETQAAREFINEHDFGITIYFHSYGNLALYPLGYDYIQPEHRSILTALAKKMTVDSDYLYGTGWEAIYPTNGDSDDWIYMSEEHDQIMPFTIEIGSRIDHFWPSPNRFEQLTSENLESCLIAAEYCDEPARILSPPQPVGVTAVTNHDGGTNIRWEETEDEINPAVSYNIRAFLPGDPFIDEIEEDQEIWKMVNCRESYADPHTDPVCFQVLDSEDMATLTLNEEIVAPETFYAWIDLYWRLSYHRIALEVSTDGFSWEALPGEDTEDLIMNDHNLGPGVGGDTDDWIRTSWNTGDYAGEMVKFRFRYYRFDHNLNYEVGYIDDIGPLPSHEWREVLAEDIQNLNWIDDDHSIEDGVLYQVQAVDADGDVSYWSVPTAIEEGTALIDIPIRLGWSLISSPVIPIDCDITAVFRNFTEKDILMFVKDENGNFYAPLFDEFNGIGNWNPLQAYQVKLNRSEELTIEGHYQEEDTPIPLERGWRLITYLPEHSMDAQDALSSISENLDIAKDGSGNFWLQEWDFNNLPDMHRCEGYFIYLDDDDTLIYPDADFAESFNRETYSNQSNFDSPSPDNHSVLMRFNAPSEASTIDLLDSDGNVSGSISISEGQMMAGIAAWGELSEGGVGFTENEGFNLILRGDNYRTDRLLSFELIEGDDAYKVNGISVLDVDLGAALQPVECNVISAYPNPFNSSSRLNYSLGEQSVVKMSIFDAAGRLIEVVASGKRSQGQHYIEWNAKGLSSGLYIARLEVNARGKSSLTQTKLLLIR
ncbi:T9SS type A sorting domain-containing protein [bacterium]|nr:T9SS type A sorting domain-containing protein [bacterium]